MEFDKLEEDLKEKLRVKLTLVQAKCRQMLMDMDELNYRQFWDGTHEMKRQIEDCRKS